MAILNVWSLEKPLLNSRAYAAGIACAWGAGMAWGLVFIVPVLLPDYPPLLLSLARYLAFGVIALLLACRDWRRLRELSRSDWLREVELTLIGNFLYYALLASAIQRVDPPLPTMLIGTLPIVIAVCAKLGEPGLAWRRLLPSLLVIGLGIALVNHQEMSAFQDQRSLADYGWGSGLALAAVACWTWYPIRNARWLQARSNLSSSTWATAQGVVTLPLAALGLLLTSVSDGYPSDFSWPLGTQAHWFLGLMLVLGLVSSWLGTLLWNRASQLLPTALSGQLIVFETLAALAYAFIWRGVLPSGLTALGVVLLVFGVVLGVKNFRAAV